MRDISVSESSFLQSLYLLPVWCDGLTGRLQALGEHGRVLRQLRLGRCQFQGVMATCRTIVLFFPVACGFGVLRGFSLEFTLFSRKYTFSFNAPFSGARNHESWERGKQLVNE